MAAGQGYEHGQGYGQQPGPMQMVYVLKKLKKD
jgi:hypothetical protein